MKKVIIAAIFMAYVSAGYADGLDDARRLIEQGDYAHGRQMAEAEAASNPKIAGTPLYNYIIGVCDFEEGNYDSARQLLGSAKSKGYAPANLYLGRLAFLDYDFEGARDFYDAFKRYREKAGQPVGERVEGLEAQVLAAENALERVEKISVIDSIAVPAENFFKSYKLPASAGRLLSPGEMPLKNHVNGVSMAFMNEGGDYMMWGEPDSVGNLRLVESLRLTDGTWHDPIATPDILSPEGYADYPFMMPDGVTLYYASDNSASMGGLDIFVVTRDAQTGEYLQPQNVGMPFNSPYDDYLLAIDEENGVGWWATDRNELGDKITIYVYKVNDMRKNYDPDDEDILEKAKLTDYRSTQNPEEKDEYRALFEVIDSIDPDKVEKKADFYLPKGNGEYYTSTEDFRSPGARSAVKKYLLAAMALEKSEENLKSLRKRYAESHADNLRETIKTEERAVEKEREEVLKLRSDIYREEKSGK